MAPFCVGPCALIVRAEDEGRDRPLRGGEERGDRAGASDAARRARSAGAALKALPRPRAVRSFVE